MAKGPMPIMKQHSTLLNRYTTITEGKDEKDQPCFNVWLKVGNQTFCTTPQPYDNRVEAEWFAEQLATALSQVVQEQRPKKGTRT